MLSGFSDLTSVQGAHILVALSGGADSTALTRLLCENRNRFHLRITAAHFNHMIRGAEADRDEQFCRKLCGELGINLIRARADIPALAAEAGIGIETCARNERYRFLRAAKEKCGADLIALAHHANDQAETVLMHLFRGTGPEGIVGMREISGDLFRPMLYMTKQDILDYLIEHGHTWCEDSTNRRSDTPRNTLRLSVLPEIEKIYPRAQEAIIRFTRSARVESDYIDRITDRYMREALDTYPNGMRLETSECPDPAILRRAIRRCCGDDLGFDKLEEIIALTGQLRGKTECPGGISCERAGNALWFIDPAYTPPTPVVLQPDETVLPGHAALRITAGKFPIAYDDPTTECVDLDAFKGAVLRTRSAGDRIHPLGAPGSRLLSDCMTDKKIERPIRDCLPLIAVDDRVLWCAGIGIGNDAKTTSQTIHPGRLDIQLFH